MIELSHTIKRNHKHLELHSETNPRPVLLANQHHMMPGTRSNTCRWVLHSPVSRWQVQPCIKHVTAVQSWCRQHMENHNQQWTIIERMPFRASTWPPGTWSGVPNAAPTTHHWELKLGHLPEGEWPRYPDGTTAIGALWAPRAKGLPGGHAGVQKGLGGLQWLHGPPWCFRKPRIACRKHFQFLEM